jgi:hypothetical protein
MFRRPCILFFILFLVSPFAVPSSAQTPAPSSAHPPSDEMNAGIVYGTNHAYTLSAPKGWVLDNESGTGQGLYAVFYPKGSSWAKGPVVMYTNTASKEEKGQETLQKMIDGDVANYRDNAQTKKILDGPPVFTKDQKKKAVVKYFLGDNRGNYEACAYIDESKIVVFIVLTAKSQREFEDNLPAFKELVGSYWFITDVVREGAPVDYSIPPDLLKQAEVESKSAEGDKYDGAMFPGSPNDIMGPDCLNNQPLGWVTLVLEIQKDGSPSHVYAEKHGKVEDCLAPKLAAAKFTPPPHAPFYELFKLNITK